jgi:hypothetical protein
MTIVVPHWSATRFMTFEQCPAEFKARYIDEQPFELTEALAFGKAIHVALEAYYQGRPDYELSFRREWKESSIELGGLVHRRLVGTGLELLDKVIALDLKGIPEYGFALDVEEDLRAPIIGAVDLWGEGVVYDFKTTRGRWSQERAQLETWQPLLYSWAYWETTTVWPSFEYIVLNRVTGKLDRFRREWTEEQWLDEMNVLWVRMKLISAQVARGEFECHGNHGFCPECGDRWSHEHVCDETVHTARRIRL